MSVVQSLSGLYTAVLLFPESLLHFMNGRSSRLTSCLSPLLIYYWLWQSKGMNRDISRIPPFFPSLIYELPISTEKNKRYYLPLIELRQSTHFLKHSFRFVCQIDISIVNYRPIAYVWFCIFSSTVSRSIFMGYYYCALIASVSIGNGAASCEESSVGCVSTFILSASFCSAGALSSWS